MKDFAIHPKVDEILSETNGILKFRDQMIAIIQTVTGFTADKANVLRRAMGSKKIVLLEPLSSEFVIGAKTRGFSTETTEKIWWYLIESSALVRTRESKKTFEYCSLQYLNQWLSNDMNYCKALASGDEENKLTALRDAGAFYKVARNLPTEYDKNQGRFKPVLDIIDSLSPADFNNDVVKSIREIEQKISKEYGNRNVLSLTTKFLWLKIKSPILIYDYQARIATGTNAGDLASYYEKWHEGFAINRDRIISACAKLKNMGEYTVNQKIATIDFIEDVSANTWFHERVYDIYLWNQGN